MEVVVASQVLGLCALLVKRRSRGDIWASAILSFYGIKWLWQYKRGKRGHLVKVGGSSLEGGPEP